MHACMHACMRTCRCKAIAQGAGIRGQASWSVRTAAERPLLLAWAAVRPRVMHPPTHPRTQNCNHILLPNCPACAEMAKPRRATSTASSPPAPLMKRLDCAGCIVAGQGFVGRLRQPRRQQRGCGKRRPHGCALLRGVPARRIITPIQPASACVCSATCDTAARTCFRDAAPAGSRPMHARMPGL